MVGVRNESRIFWALSSSGAGPLDTFSSGRPLKTEAAEPPRDKRPEGVSFREVFGT